MLCEQYYAPPEKPFEMTLKLLDIEKRTGVKDKDIGNFLEKVDDVQEKLRKLMSGELKPEDIKIPGQKTEQELKEAVQISMGTEISQDDLNNIKQLADQVVSLSEYRIQLYDYLKSRMNAIAPNLTVLVGELVPGALPFAEAIEFYFDGHQII